MGFVALLELDLCSSSAEEMNFQCLSFLLVTNRLQISSYTVIWDIKSLSRSLIINEIIALLRLPYLSQS